MLLLTIYLKVWMREQELSALEKEETEAVEQFKR